MNIYEYNNKIDMNTEVKKKFDIYIVETSNMDGDRLVKVGYSSNIVDRILQYEYHNPLQRTIGLVKTSDGKALEKYIHDTYEAVFFNEWYDLDTYRKIVEDLELTIVPYNKDSIIPDKYTTINDTITPKYIIERLERFKDAFNIDTLLEDVRRKKPALYDLYMNHSKEEYEKILDVDYAELASYFKDNHVNGIVDWGVYSYRKDWITIIESLYRLTGSIDTNYTQARQALDAHGDSYKELIFKLRNQFKVGRYSNKEINDKLQKVYDDNDLDRRAKSSDLYEIFGENNVKSFRTSSMRGMEILKI